MECILTRCKYPAILTEKARSMNDLLYGYRGICSCGIQQVVPIASGRESAILPARVANHSARFGSSFSPLKESAM